MKYYACKIAVKPTTLTAGTVYQSFVNTDSKSLRIMKIHLQLDSADAGGGANSIYAFARIKGNPVGTDLTPTKYDTGDEPSAMSCKRNQAGLDMTAVTQEPYFLERSIVSKTTGAPCTIQFDGENGFILKPNEGLCIFADNNVIAGSGVFGFLEWCEE
jgi:hypothetical protein